MKCDNQNQSIAACTCTYPCPRRGKCCECVEYHRSKNQLPGCFFSKEAEATYDRSYRYFASLHR